MCCVCGHTHTCTHTRAHANTHRRPRAQPVKHAELSSVSEALTHLRLELLLCPVLRNDVNPHHTITHSVCLCHQEPLLLLGAVAADCSKDPLYATGSITLQVQSLSRDLAVVTIYRKPAKTLDNVCVICCFYKSEMRLV